MAEITPNAGRAAPFFQHELWEIGITIKPSKVVAQPPKGRVPTPEEIDLLGGIGARIAEGGGVQVVGVPIGNDPRAVDSAIELARDSGAEQLARMLSCTGMPQKQSALEQNLNLRSKSREASIHEISPRLQSTLNPQTIRYVPGFVSLL